MLSDRFELCISLGAFGRVGYVEAMLKSVGLTQPTLGEISLSHAQLCPQNSGLIDENMVDQLSSSFKNTQFRLHANAMVQEKRIISDLANFKEDQTYWAQLAKISKSLKAPAYSAHAGRRKFSTMEEVIHNTRLAEDLFGCPVALEGHYPAIGNPFLVSTCKEYQTILNAGIHYALYLSHLNIVASHSKRYEKNLVREMLNSPQCIEVHISGNDGQYDAHQEIETMTVWCEDLNYINDDAVIFSECQVN